MIEVEKNKYEIIKDVKNAFKEEEFKEMYTDYYNDYDYIVGDIAYSKTRLKGFYEENNKKVKNMNNIKNLENYLKEYCAVDCAYFILKKTN